MVHIQSSGIKTKKQGYNDPAIPHLDGYHQRTLVALKAIASAKYYGISLFFLYHLNKFGEKNSILVLAGMTMNIKLYAIPAKTGLHGFISFYHLPQLFENLHFLQ